MANRWRHYSYVAQKSYLRRIRAALSWVLVFFVLYSLVTGLFLSNHVLENRTMEPGCRAGDRLIFSNYTLTHLLTRGSNPPFKRGQIVLVDRSGEKRGLIKTLLDALLRFFTLQRMTLFPRENSVFIKRVIALPGDTVSINRFSVRVKPAGEQYEYMESELADRDYVPGIPQVSMLWDNSLPFASSTEARTLAEGECFLLSDDRSNTNDSRTWGPVPVRAVTGRALVRYWPPTRIGPP